MPDSDEERREYFRINDQVSLDYRVIDEAEFDSIPTSTEATASSDFMLGASLAALDYEFSSVFNQLQKDSPDVAKYFGLINQKIDILRQAILQNTPEIEKEKLSVDLSAAGLAFPCNEALEIDSKIELQLILHPEFIGMQVYAIIRQCAREGDTYMIGADFQHLRESDREILIRHNLNIQMLQLRSRNESD